MTRQAVRTLKRSLRSASETRTARDSALARQCALELLARSIRFGHTRLAIVRLAMAVDAGAEPQPEHWSYCARVVGMLRVDARLVALYRRAIAQSEAASRLSQVRAHG